MDAKKVNYKNYPVYDDDLVNKAYVDQLTSEISDNIDFTGDYSKNFGSTPIVPYHKNDTWTNYTTGQIYVCVNTRLIGEFNLSDWKLTGTDDSSLIEFIEGEYAINIDEIENQIDQKIQTWYQESDPELEWITTLLKDKHVGDLWYNPNTNVQKQYRYDSITNTYSWLVVDAPKSLYDIVDTKKAIYVTKPNSYSKNDLWIIEDTLTDLDLPPDVSRGDMVLAVINSTTYDKNHWKKFDHYVDDVYIGENYYNKTNIDQIIVETTEDIEASIQTTADNILLEVDAVKTTAETALNEVGEVVQEIVEVNQNIADINIAVDAIDLRVTENSSRIATKLTLPKQSFPPNDPDEGDLWYNTEFDIIYVYHENTNWTPTTLDPNIIDNYYTKQQSDAMISIENDLILSQVSSLYETKETSNLNYSRLEQSIAGLELSTQTSGGYNLLENCVKQFGQRGWTGTFTNLINQLITDNSLSKSALVFNNGTELRRVSTVNGIHNITLKYLKLVPLSINYIEINGQRINLDGNSGWQETQLVFTVTNNEIIIKYFGDTNNGLWLVDPLVIPGNTKRIWTPNPNEINTGIIKLGGDQLIIDNNTGDTMFVADPTGTRVYNKSTSQIVSEYTKDGTKNLHTESESALIAGLNMIKIIYDDEPQAWVTFV